MTIMTSYSNPQASPRISIVEAKARLADCLRRAEAGELIVVTRHGKPVAALVPVDLLDQLDRLRAMGAEGGLASVAGGWQGSEEIAERAVAYKRTVGRKTPDIG
jgi:prevent-host-death family protein